MSQASLNGARFVLRLLRAHGHEALLAGGCVRDRLLGLQPKDFDIATSASPEQVAGIFAVTEAVGAAFGVILVIHEGAAYEVATFRQDGSYVDGRHPESVSFASPEQDALRRDFTVNALFGDPDKNEVLDLVGGRADLEKKILRCVGVPEQRFAEDRLRVLRAIRFAVQLGFEIDSATWAAAKAAAAQVPEISVERIQVELTKTLSSPDPERGLKLLDETGLLRLLLPELEALKGCPQPPEFHPEGDVWVHTLLVMKHLKNPSPALAWAGLLHDIAKPATLTQAAGDRIRFNGHESKGAEMARAIFQRLKMSGELSQRAETLIADHLRLNPIKEMKLATLKRLLRRDDFDELLELHRADCLASHGQLELYDLALVKKREFEGAVAAESLRPAPLLDGADLISLGHKPGPLFKEILAALEDEQLEGRLSDKEAALAWIIEKYPLK